MAKKIKKAQEGTSILTLLNPKNWGVEDFSNESSFSSAYKQARTQGLQEFMFNGKRYNTDYKGSSNEQFKRYGNTNKSINSDVDEGARKVLKHLARSNKNSLSPGESLDRLYDIHERIGSPSVNLDTSVKRSNYNAFTNNMNINQYSNYATEAAHAAQSNLALKVINDWFKDPYISEEGYNRQYSREGSAEHTAHEVIEPRIRDLMDNTIPLKKDSKTIFENGGKVMKKKKTVYNKGGVIKDNLGQLKYPGKITQIDSPNITMKGIPYPVLGVSDLGDTKMMYPNQDYVFNGNNVTEYPMMKKGGKMKGYQKGGILPSPQQQLDEVLLKNYLLQERNQKRDSVRHGLIEQYPNITQDQKVVQGMLDYYKTEPQEYLMLDTNVLDEKRKKELTQKFGKKYQPGGIVPSYTQESYDPMYNQVNPYQSTNTQNQPNLVNRIGGQNIYQGIGGIAAASQANSADGYSGAQRAVGQFGPWGSAISQVSNAVTRQTDKSDNEGVYTAGKVIFDPASAWTNKDLSKTDRILGGLNPIYGGIKAFKAKEEKERKAKELERIVQEAGSFQDTPRNRYVRPEDQITDPNELYPTYGVGTSYLKHGGEVPYMERGGELETYNGGEAEIASENPYLPGKETVMFRGKSHKEGGIDIKFGKTKVEVEGGEPATKLDDGLVVFGDMKIPSYGVSELMDPKAKGKKFKNYVNDLNELENKQNKTVEKGVKLVNDTPIVDSFDKLKVSSGKALIEGGNMKLKQIANKKQIAANIQNAILETAEELGLKSDELSKGKFKKAKNGTKLKAQPGGGPYAHHTNYDDKFIVEDGFAGITQPNNIPNQFDWMTAANQVLPFLRPSNQRKLDPNQLAGERYALATNQLEGVQAQTYTPLLEQVSDISLQDQMNANQADFNSLARMTANNPAAQTALAAQKYQANSSVLGEQFRLNQANKQGIYNRNRGVLNDATLKNLAILDQQYVRQSTAKSNTKAVAQAALNSISEKIARNKLENRTLGTYENLYNYRYDNKGRAWNMNPFAQFAVDQGHIQVDEQGQVIIDESKVKRDKNGMIINSTDTQRVTSEKNKKNGGLVRSIKSY